MVDLAPVGPDAARDPENECADLSDDSPDEGCDYYGPDGTGALSIGAVGKSFIGPGVTKVRSGTGVASIIPVIEGAVDVKIRCLTPFLAMHGFSPSCSSIVLVALHGTQVGPFS